MTGGNLVKIELDDKTARQYELFCKYYDQWEVMNRAKVFETRFGSVTLNFKDTPGKIMSIRGDLPLYFRDTLV